MYKFGLYMSQWQQAVTLEYNLTFYRRKYFTRIALNTQYEIELKLKKPLSLAVSPWGEISHPSTYTFFVFVLDWDKS